jgi:multiple sugar transport system permease protein
MANAKSRNENTAPHYSLQLRKLWLVGMVTMIAVVICVVYLLPFGNMALISIKDSEQQVASATGSILPLSNDEFEYEGTLYPVYTVPFIHDDGSEETLEMALVQQGRQSSQFVDIHNPEAGLQEWVGNWRGLQPVTYLDPRWSNYSDAWTGINFPRVFANTLYIAIVGLTCSVQHAPMSVGKLIPKGLMICPILISTLNSAL